jgi:hypothetical protein
MIIYTPSDAKLSKMSFGKVVLVVLGVTAIAIAAKVIQEKLSG